MRQKSTNDDRVSDRAANRQAIATQLLVAHLNRHDYTHQPLLGRDMAALADDLLTALDEIHDREVQALTRDMPVMLVPEGDNLPARMAATLEFFVEHEAKITRALQHAFGGNFPVTPHFNTARDLIKEAQARASTPREEPI